MGDFYKIRSPMTGNEYDVRLTEEELENVQSNETEFNQLCQKYDDLFEHGVIEEANTTQNLRENSDYTSFENDDDSQNKPLYGKISINAEDEEYFIPLVQKRPQLWDFRLPMRERGSSDTIRSLWQEVIDELGVVMSVDDIKKKWKSVKDSYIRARNLVKKRISSGASAEDRLEAERVKKRHRNFEMLEFLDDFMENRRTSSNLSDSDSQQQASVSGISSSEQPPKKKSKGLTEADQEFLNTLKTISATNTSNAVQLTGCQHFGMQIASSLEKLPEKARTRVQIKILEVIADAEETYL